VAPKPPRAKRKFTPGEDERLRGIVGQLGDSNWKLIATHMGDRDYRQCRERWKNYLAPGVCRGPWAPEEDRLLQLKFSELGSQWSAIARFFPGRTDVNLKNRWVVLANHGGAGAPRPRKGPQPMREAAEAPEPDAWPDARMSRYCEEAELCEGDFSAPFGPWMDFQ
jgi:hypothetical protein